MNQEPDQASSRLERFGDRASSAFRLLFRAARSGLSEFRKDRPTQIAAALTYHTLFSLLPVMALALVMLRTFVGPEEQLAFKDFVVEQALQWLALKGEAGQQSIAPVEGEAVSNEFGATIARIDESVMDLLNRLQNINFQSIGAVGVLLFIYAATGLLVTVETSFNQIYGVKEGRRWHRRLPLYYTAITLAPIVIIAGQVLQEQAVRELGSVAWTQWLILPATGLYPLLTTWVVFFLLYVLLPNARVQLRAAALGAVLAAFASVILLELFSVYTSMYAGKTLYGSLALLPLSMLWLWLNWLIVLFGLEVSYVLQTGLSEETKGTGKRLVGLSEMCDARWLVIVMSAVSEHFNRGEKASVEAIALRLRIPDIVVETLADQLVEEGFLHRVGYDENGDEDVSYVLAKPADQIAIKDIFGLWPGTSIDDDEVPALPGGDVVLKVHAAFEKSLSDLNLGSGKVLRSANADTS